jgi:tRNA-2-methylthio-N6-dimethylallyladenosine synthase
VGFCGETEEEFQQSVDLVRESRFKNSFIFKYSVRPGTKAAELYPDDVAYDVKRRRNNELLDLQNRISEEDNRHLIGRTFDVLVEGPSKKEGEGPPAGVVQLTGRSHADRIVVFDGDLRQVGKILPVTIYDCTAHTLIGNVVTHEAGPRVYALGGQGGDAGDGMME